MIKKMLKIILLTIIFIPTLLYIVIMEFFHELKGAFIYPYYTIRIEFSALINAYKELWKGQGHA